MEYDAVIVGSGPGGASAARELCRAGKRVIMLEYGSDSQRLGNHLSLLDKIDWKNALPLAHPVMVRGITTGGSSLIYCATAARPPAFIKEQTGIDLIPYAEAFEKELGVAPLRDRLVGRAATRIMGTANALGMDWRLLPKFINPDKWRPDCGKCMLGCTRGAKWTARDFLKEARAMGMELRTRARVAEVIEKNGEAVGVRGDGPDGPVEIRAERVVLAAGGLGTPVILKRSGISGAGQGFFIDPLLFTYGECDQIDKGSIYDIPMTAGTWQFHEAEGFLLTDLAEPWILLCLSMLSNLPPRIDRVPRVRGVLGIMTKSRTPSPGPLTTRAILRSGLSRRCSGAFRLVTKERARSFSRRVSRDPHSLPRPSRRRTLAVLRGSAAW